MGAIRVLNRIKPGDSSDTVTQAHTGVNVDRAVDLFASKTQVQTAQEWYETNPALQQGFFGYDSTNRRVKVGDGFTSWNDLEWVEDHGLNLIREEYGNEVSFDTALANFLSS